ncbi:MAG: hypothetical protein GXN92_03265, partial [Candidatus Micrarchaeota archaeon]|nr:hypothetical protein [Candidatus Micrarchaeota archaeon]
MRLRLKEKSFAEKMADKKDLIKQYGKEGLKFYNELSKKGELTQKEVMALLTQYGLPLQAFDYLLEKGILEKIEEEEKPPELVVPTKETPPTPPEPPIKKEEAPPVLEPPKEETTP